MLRKPLLLVALLYLLVLPVCAQDTAQNLPLKLQALSVQAENWPESLRWQKAPYGVGEFLPYPNPPGQEEFVWGKRRLLGTKQGLLYSDDKDEWQIVPSLYKQSVRVVGEGQDQLWLEYTDPDKGLFALNRNLEVVRRLPSVKGNCIAIEPQGFWCLENQSSTRDSNPRYQALVEYNSGGKEKRRFVGKDLGLVTAPPPVPIIQKENAGFGGFDNNGVPSFINDGFNSDKSAVGWAAVAAEAVWVSVNNYTWTGPLPTHPSMRFGKEQLGRLDRTTGKFTPLLWAPTRGKETTQNNEALQLLNLPDSIQWISRLGFDASDIYQLDKRTLQVSRLLRLMVPEYNIKTRGKNLWVLSNNFRHDMQVYSRETLDPVSIEEAGVPPINEFYSRPDNWKSISGVWFWLGILGDDEDGIWLSARWHKLLHISDEDKQMAYDVSYVLWSTESNVTPHTPPGQFLWTDQEQLVRIESNGKTTRLSLGGRWLDESDETKLSVQFLAATPQRIWYYTNEGQLVTLAPDLSEPREIPQSPLFGSNSSNLSERITSNKSSIAVGNALYMWADSGHMLRVDGVTGEVKVIESWRKRSPDQEDQTSLRRELTGRNAGAFALPDGRIAFKFSPKTYYMDAFMFFKGEKIEDRPHLFIFDPIKDTWQESDSSIQVQPLTAGKKLYGYDKTQIYEWRGDGWMAIGKPPVASLPMFNQYRDSEPKVVGTVKYFYQETALGLYRVPWTQIGGRTP